MLYLLTETFNLKVHFAKRVRCAQPSRYIDVSA